MVHNNNSNLTLPSSYPNGSDNTQSSSIMMVSSQQDEEAVHIPQRWWSGNNVVSSNNYAPTSVPQNETDADAVDDDDDEFQQQPTAQRSCGPCQLRVGAGSWILVLMMVCLLLLPLAAQYHPRTHGGSFFGNTKSTAALHLFPHASATYASAAVATDQALCSQLGTDILQNAGGNAIDAMVTVALCLGVVHPASSGLGGGAFVLLRTANNTSSTTNNNPHYENMPEFIDARDRTNNATNSTNDNNNDDDDSLQDNLHAFDCRETAPAAATAHMFEQLPTNASVLGGLAIPVPGELHCLAVAHAHFGTLPWSTVVKPVAQLLEQGKIKVSPQLAAEIAGAARRFLGSNVSYADGLRRLVTVGDEWTRPLPAGATLRNPQLAATLRAIARDGVAALYDDNADALAREVQAAGGVVTADDLRNYRPVWRTPVVTQDVLGGLAVAGVPPPSSGGAVVLGALRFLSGFATNTDSDDDALAVHRLVEAAKHGFAVRMSLSDPDYNGGVVRDAVEDLVRGNYMHMLRETYYRDNTTLPLSAYGGPKWALLKDAKNGGDEGSSTTEDAHEGDRRRHRKLLRPFGYLEDSGTSHFSIVDADGNAMSMTTSVNTIFGSTVVSPSTGILFSNTMDDFAQPPTTTANISGSNFFGLVPAESNYIAPGKRPLSSMSPTMVFSGNKLVLAVGGSGGPKIISAVLQVIVRHILPSRIPLLDAIIHARVHDQLVYHGSSVTTTEEALVMSTNGGMERIFVSERTKEALRERHHALLNVDYMGTVQAIAVDLETNELTAACDPRKGGAPAGY